MTNQSAQTASALSNSASSLTWTTSTGGTSGTASFNGIYSNGGNTSGYIYSFDDYFNNTPKLDAFTLMITALQESKIIEIMDILSTNLSQDEFKKVIKCTVGARHFSEDFLLKYIDYLDQEVLFMQHRENIKSREYESVTLYLETKEKK